MCRRLEFQKASRNGDGTLNITGTHFLFLTHVERCGGLDLLVSMGVPIENVWVTDIIGVVYAGRTELMDDNKARYAKRTEARTLADILPGADVFTRWCHHVHPASG